MKKNSYLTEKNLKSHRGGINLNNPQLPPPEKQKDLDIEKFNFIYFFLWLTK